MSTVLEQFCSRKMSQGLFGQGTPRQSPPLVWGVASDLPADWNDSCQRDCVCVYNATVDQLIPRHSEVVRKSVAGPSCDDPRTSEGKLLLAAPVNYCILANHGKPNLMGGRYEEGASTDPPACCWIPLPRLQVHKRTGPALAKIL